jgi:hypothetical protein
VAGVASEALCCSTTVLGCNMHPSEACVALVCCVLPELRRGDLIKCANDLTYVMLFIHEVRLGAQWEHTRAMIFGWCSREWMDTSRCTWCVFSAVIFDLKYSLSATHALLRL